MRNIPCVGGGGVFLPPAVKEHFSDGAFYTEAEAMAAFSLALKENTGRSFCVIPFCHTVEGEALGAHIRIDEDGRREPRAAEPAFCHMEQVMTVTGVSFETGRIGRVLQAAEQLNRQGQQVLLNVAGPLTICDTLLPSEVLLKALRKEPEEIKTAFEKLGEFLLDYIRSAYAKGVRTISFGDAMLGVGILGPRIMERLMKDFYGPFLLRMEELLPEDLEIRLCPKLAGALEDTGFVSENDRWHSCCLNQY